MSDAMDCWRIPSLLGCPNRVRSEGGTFAFNGLYAPLRPKPAKSLAAQAPQGFGAAPHGDCTHTAVLDTRRIARLG